MRQNKNESRGGGKVLKGEGSADPANRASVLTGLSETIGVLVTGGLPI